MPHIFVTPNFLLNQFRRDAPEIAATFDHLCESDVAEISTLLAQGMTIVGNGMHQVDDELRLWSGGILINIANTLSAAVYVLRAGYRLVPGAILRNALEAMAVCLHALQKPNDFQKIRSGEFDSPSAIRSAKAVIPPFGWVYGFLSKQFAHIGPLHNSIQPVAPFVTREADLVVNLRDIRVVVWMFYVVVEFAFVDSAPVKRYWRILPRNVVMFAPSKSEQEWRDNFLQATELEEGNHE